MVVVYISIYIVGEEMCLSLFIFHGLASIRDRRILVIVISSSQQTAAAAAAIANNKSKSQTWRQQVF